MFESFFDCKCVHFPAVLVGAILNGCFQEMPGNLNGERIGDDSPGTLLVLHPGWMRQSNPYGPAAGQKFHIHSIGVARGYRYDQGLINAMQPFSRPTINSVKVLVHTFKTISDRCTSGNDIDDNDPASPYYVIDITVQFVVRGRVTLACARGKT